MNAELKAYLDRLIIPARKAYAQGYADHLISGAAAPKLPKGLDADTAAKIQRKVAKYAKAKAGTQPSPDRAEPTAADIAASLRAYAEQREDSELLGLLEAFVPSTPAEVEAGGCMHRMLDHMEREVEGELEYEAMLQSERLADYYQPERTPAFIDTAECDALDITDLEPSLSRALALKLTRWNNGGKVYERRNGRRYLARHIKHIDLNDPTVQALPNYSDLITVCKERGIHHA